MMYQVVTSKLTPAANPMQRIHNQTITPPHEWVQGKQNQHICNVIGGA